ncbi:MAG: archease, partial [Thermocladium sp.]
MMDLSLYARDTTYVSNNCNWRPIIGRKPLLWIAIMRRMMAEKRFEYADHTADIMIIARGRSLGEAFKNAALGVLNLMYDTSRVRALYSHRVELKGIDLEQLLFNWIDEVIYQFDGAKMAIGDEIDVDINEENISLRA